MVFLIRKVTGTDTNSDAARGVYLRLGVHAVTAAATPSLYRRDETSRVELGLSAPNSAIALLQLAACRSGRGCAGWLQSLGLPPSIRSAGRRPQFLYR